MSGFNKTNKVIPSDLISAFTRFSKNSLVLVGTSNSRAMTGVVPMQIIETKIQVTPDISNLKRNRENFEDTRLQLIERLVLETQAHF